MKRFYVFHHQGDSALLEEEGNSSMMAFRGSLPDLTTQDQCEQPVSGQLEQRLALDDRLVVRKGVKGL